MSVKQHIVSLSPEERATLRSMLGRGVASARTLTRARILLKADTGAAGPRLSDAAIAAAVEVSARTVARVRADWAAGGLDRAIRRQTPRRVYARRFDEQAVTQFVALACSPPPTDRASWSLRLLADRVVELGIVEQASHETIRAVLKKTSSNRG